MNREEAWKYLEMFVPLLSQDAQQRREESEANKAWHMSDKTYEAVPTLAGHEPADKLES